jgi:putative membrane protein
MQPLRFFAFLLLVIGLGLFLGLIGYLGVGDVLLAVAQAGWGLLVVALWRVLPLAVWAQSWRVLLPPGRQQAFLPMLWMRWTSESVNALLPVAQLGGEVVRARLLALRGVSGSVAGASVVGDMTGAILSEIAFALLGVGLLLSYGGSGWVSDLLLGVSLFALLLGGFLWAQHAGMFVRLAQTLERFAGGREWLSLVGGAAALDREVVAVYRRGLVFWRSTLWHFLGWLLQIGETWLGLRFLGQPVTLTEAAMIETLSQAIRSAAFLVPGGLGVQEGALVLVGQIAGVAPDTALALSLVKRVRELAVGLPALALWHWVEGRRLLRKRAPI